MRRLAIVVITALLSACAVRPEPARPRPSTGHRVAHGLNIGFTGAIFGLSFFEAYASSRGSKRLDAMAWTEYRQGVSSQPVPSIPLFQVASVASGGTVLGYDRNPRTTRFILAGTGVLLGVAGIVATLAITAPVQSEIDGWDPANPPVDWEDDKRDLQRANVIRTVLHGAALGFNIAALAVTW